MRIRKLELQGFKSFVDRQTFHFGDGIAGVVGPNGCGKSNVVDAIKWCLGEMSAKSLRGGAMQDVIFSGSEGRSAVGMAEVSLTFGNGGDPFPGQWARYEEVLVTRRLYRDGTSEYLINRERVRRKDIQDLFLDTGVTNSMYSFIEQGRVGQIINAKPEERRALIEEAAGISRYKARRSEALSKLESTEGNLARVSDVCDEMSRRIRSLERQVEKATKYRRLSAVVRQGELFLGLVKYGGLSGDRKVLQDDLRSVLRDEETHGRELERRDQMLQGRRDQIEVMEMSVGSLRDRLGEMEAERRELESARHYQTRESENLTRRLDVLLHDMEELVSQRDTAAAQASGMQGELEATRALVAGEDGRLETARQAALDTKERRLEDQSETDTLKDRVMELVTGLSRLRTQLVGNEARQAEIEEALAAQQAEGNTVGQDLQRMASELSGIGETVEETRQALEEKEAALNTCRDRRAAAASEKTALAMRQNELESRVTQAARALAGTEARLGSLREMQEARLGMDEGARALAAAADSLGTLAENLDCTAEGEAQLEALLGPALQHVLVSDRKALTQAANLAADAPRTGVMWVDSTVSAKGLALDFGANGPGRAALARLLKGWERAPDLDCALALHEKKGCGVLVDSGEVISPEGVLFVGRLAVDQGGAVLRRKRQITDLECQLAEQTGLLQKLTAERSALVAEAETLEARFASEGKDLEEARQAAEGLRLALSEAQHRHREAIASHTRHESQAQEILSEREKLDKDLILLSAASREHRATIEADEGALILAEERLGHLRTRAAETEAAATLAGETLARVETEHRASQERLDLLESTWRGAVERQESALERLERFGAEQLEARERIVVLSEEDSRLNETIQSLGEQQAQLRAALHTEGEKLREERAGLQNSENALRELRDAREQATNKRIQLELKVQEARFGVENLRQQVEERYQVSLPGLLDRLEREAVLVLEAGEKANADLPLEGNTLAPVEDLRVTPELLENREVVEAWVEKLGKGKASLARLGEVNLAALEEYEEVQGRYSYLDEQRVDLEESVEAIRKAIAQINRTCRERFREAFDKVNARFRETYPQLVGGGGKAHLNLTNEEDLLETGVEIYVQPPGKRLQALTLLSGGEKAMCAIALIFALFLVKPSPFCLLDEVDAPLDEGNGGRFNGMLQQMAELSQFIVITHNKKTMEAVDTLYGVTMPDPGVSRLVSVQIH